jgi:hypothetical protein
MTLLVKDANTTTQPISTQADSAGNLVPLNAPAVVVGGVAAPVASGNPLPVINAAGAVAVDGSGTIAAGASAQILFAVAPVNGFMVANNSSATLFVSDVGTASQTGTSFPIAAGAIFMTPSGYKPAGPVSIYGGTTGQAFSARRW